MRATRSWAVAGLVACVWCASADVYAATPQEKAVARSMFEEGKALAAQGKYAEACPKLEESFKIEPGVGAQFHLADCFEHIGKTASAWALFLDAASRSRDAGQGDREEVLRQRAAALEPKLAKLTIRVPQEADIAGLEVTRDGAAVGKGMWGTPVPVDPGAHVVLAKAPGRKTWTATVNVGDAAKESLNVPVLEMGPVEPEVKPVESAPPVVDKKPITPPPATSSRAGSTQRTVGLVVGGAGLLGLGLAAYFGLNTLSKLDDSKPYCEGDTCWDQKGVDLRHDAVTSQTTSYVMTGIGGALLVTGVVVYLTAPRPRTHQSAWTKRVPAVSLTPAGVLVSGSW